jgi:hypothetical protein
VPPDPPRALRPEERATLLALLDHADFRGRDELIEQVEVTQALRECSCGCASIDLVVDPAAPPAVGTWRPIPNEAEVIDGEGEHVGGVIVFTEDGYLSSLEIFTWLDDPINPFPPPERLRLVTRGPRPA